MAVVKKCKYGCVNGKVFLEKLGGFVDCPECRSIDRVLDTPQEDGTSLFEKLSIPPTYKDYGTSGRELFNVAGIDRFSTTSINTVSNLLERINKDVYSGRVTSTSAYIFASNLVDIKRFVYGVQKMGIEKGLGVTPYISLNTLWSMIKCADFSPNALRDLMGRRHDKDIQPDVLAASDGYRCFQETGLSYKDFTSADLVILNATAATTDKGWMALADILEERSKRGLPTYVIGYWGSRASGAYRGLNYLLTPEGGISRLDKLTSYEVISRSNTNEGVHVETSLDVGVAKSGVTAGLSAESLMG